jgi:predicted unusual protein kinase regulating ubiquinone biosynthesis (AarF/ABC1/UbiB family)
MVAKATRVARVATTAASLGGQMAANQIQGQLRGGQTKSQTRSLNAEALRAALGQLRGPIMKVAQLLATIPEALPEEYVTELRQLQSHAPPMGWVFVRRRMAAELGEGWADQFKAFEKTASAAASLGQVHRAIAMDGTALACKLQYPDMDSIVEADLGQLKFLMGIYESFDKAVRVSAAHSEIAARLREELDYTREGHAMSLYSAMLASEKNVRVPEWRANLSTPRLLTMTWLDGKPIMDFRSAPQEQRNQIALNLFRAWYVPFYEYGVIHGDPHPGNYTVGKGDVINLLDFGCVRIFDASFVRGVIDLYRALETHDNALAVSAYETWGFKKLTKAHIETLNIWARFLYGPLLDDKTRLIGQLDGTGVYGKSTAMQVHAELKKIGGIEIPQAFVFMDRAALGLGSVFLHLNATLNWHQLFHELIAGFDEEQLAQRQAKMLTKFKLN